MPTFSLFINIEVDYVSIHDALEKSQIALSSSVGNNDFSHASENVAIVNSILKNITSEMDASVERTESFKSVKTLAENYVPTEDNAVQLSQMLSSVWSEASQVNLEIIEDVIFEAESVRYEAVTNNVVTVWHAK